jgi:DNA invertase Pin-like site-specific DNA recombinase
MVYAYLRISTDKQTIENQKYEVLKFADKINVTIDEWVEETISGTKKSKDRILGKVLESLKKGDTLIVTELSRLGRSLFDVMSILNDAMEKEVILYSIKEGYTLGANISSKVLAFAFGLSAEIERQLISQRTKEALQRRKAEGKSLGRPKGFKLEVTKLTPHEEEIRKLVGYGVSMRSISRIYECHHNTVSTFIKNKKLK